MAAVPLRVLVVDDHPLFRYGLCAMLATVDGIEIVGEESTARGAVAAAMTHQPNVVVMDLHLAESNGIEATTKIVHRNPSVGVLVLTMLDDDESILAALRAGARGYLLKGAGEEEITRAVHAVGHGEAIFGPAVAARVLRLFSAPPAGPSLVFPELTDREREVLMLIADGRSNAVIARALAISQKTVRNHASNIFAKLHVAGRAQAIVLARSAGMGARGAAPSVPAQRWSRPDGQLMGQYGTPVPCARDHGPAIVIPRGRGAGMPRGRAKGDVG
jgi:DNA-binding NarL/FixJ family response regulator